MANPPQLLRADGLDERVLQIRPWSVGVVTRSVPAPARLMSHGPSGLMAWATHPTALHARAQEASFCFVATL
jgi:hypothetical protein